MAVMTPAQRRECWQEMMQEWSEGRKPIPVNKDVLLAGVNAIDQLLSDPAQSLSSVLPPKLVASMDRDQLSDLFATVFRKRMEAR